MRFKVESFSGDGSYSVDASPGVITCTCPDFAKSRSFFQTNDPRRLCKHLVSVFADLGEDKCGEFSIFFPAIEWLNGNGNGFFISPMYTVEDLLPEEIIFIINEGEWKNVIYKGKLYGYSVRSGFWAGRNEPPKAEKVADKIAELDASGDYSDPIIEDYESRSASRIRPASNDQQKNGGPNIMLYAILIFVIAAAVICGRNSDNKHRPTPATQETVTEPKNVDETVAPPQPPEDILEDPGEPEGSNQDRRRKHLLGR